MHALFGVLHRLLIRTLHDADALHTYTKTRRVHHDEHVFEAAIFFADQLANRAAIITELQHRRRAGFDAQFVLQRQGLHVIGSTQTAVFVNQEFRYDEQRNAFDAFGRIRRAREYKVHDVVGVIMVAKGDENFGTKNFIATIGLRFGTRANQCQIGAGLRLGQIHRAGPLTGNQTRDVGLFLRVATGSQHRFNRAVGEQGAQAERGIRAIDHLITRRGDQFRQVLSTHGFRVRQTLPAALHILLERGFKTRAGGDFTILEKRRLLVTHAVGRCDHVLIDFRRFIQNPRDSVHVQIHRRVLHDLWHLGNVFQGKQHIFLGRDVAHDSTFFKNVRQVTTIFSSFNQP